MAGPTISPISCIRLPNNCIGPTPTLSAPSNASGSTIPRRPSPANSTRCMGTPSRTDAPKRPRRWRAVLAGVAGLLLLAGLYLFGYEPPYRGTLVARPARTLVFAHRGFGDLGPDNSLYAVEHALEAGMDGVDVDGQLTRDSELVIFHDLSVDRLTSGIGRVREKTRAEML